jgi:single-strand binding protein
MSRSLNKVLLIGNVGVDPILKKTPGGIPVTSFRMATSQTWKDRNGALKEQPIGTLLLLGVDWPNC